MVDLHFVVSLTFLANSSTLTSWVLPTFTTSPLASTLAVNDISPQLNCLLISQSLDTELLLINTHINHFFQQNSYINPPLSNITAKIDA